MTAEPGAGGTNIATVDDRPIEPRARPGRRRRRAWSWVVVGALLLAGGVAAALVLLFDDANERYDDALDRHREAGESAEIQLDALQGETADATETADLAGELLTAATDGYTDAAAKAELAATVAELDAALDDSRALGDVRIAEEPTPESRPWWIADLHGQAERIVEDAAELGATATTIDVGADAVTDAADRVAASGSTLVATIPATAASIDAATGSARNADRIAFRKVVELVTATSTTWDLDTVSNIEGYLAAAAAVQASHAAEEAEKAGPLYEQRIAVEAFARSIAGGVLLEFDWAPEVNGYGSGGSYGGTATWNVDAGGFSSIALSDSVAELWPSDGVASLVAHEVGHAITAKCFGDIITPETAEQNEQWATAWAIGLGYTADGSGESIYGRPPDELIERSKACR